MKFRKSFIYFIILSVTSIVFLSLNGCGGGNTDSRSAEYREMSQQMAAKQQKMMQMQQMQQMPEMPSNFGDEFSGDIDVDYDDEFEGNFEDEFEDDYYADNMTHIGCPLGAGGNLITYRRPLHSTRSSAKIKLTE